MGNINDVYEEIKSEIDEISLNSKKIVINSNEYMNEYINTPEEEKIFTCETTLKYFISDKNEFRIYCDPPINKFNRVLLKRENPNFINLYNKIKCHDTYQFKYIFVEEILTPRHLCDVILLDINECPVHEIHGEVMGFLNLGNEIRPLEDYEEIIIQNNKTKRLIKKKGEFKNMNIGESYIISYVKTYSSNFYKITDIELITV